MPPHDNSFGKNDPINLVNRDDERRNRSGSAAEEDAEMWASSTPPSLLGSLSVPLLVVMFGLSAAGNGGAPPPLPPPPAAAMRMEGPVGPLRREEIHAILRDVLAMIDEDDFADTTQGASSRGEGGSRGYNSDDHNPAQ